MNQLMPVLLADTSPERSGLTQAAEGLPRRAFTVAESSRSIIPYTAPHCDFACRQPKDPYLLMRE